MMGEKKIVINIGKDGSMDAETFGMSGMECLDEIDKLMKDLALSGSYQKKKEFYEQKSSVDQAIINKHD